jgi:hypothetical protein
MTPDYLLALQHRNMLNKLLAGDTNPANYPKEFVSYYFDNIKTKPLRVTYEMLRQLQIGDNDAFDESF